MRKIGLRLVVLAGVLALTGCKMGPDITPAKMVQIPDAEKMRAAYPTFARIAGIEGKVWMRCGYTTAGTLERCRKRGVAPEGLNFDKAIPFLLAEYLVEPQTIDGKIAPGEIDFVIHFAPPSAPPAWTGDPVTDDELRSARRIVTAQLAMVDRYGERGNAHRSVAIDRYQPVADMLDRAFTAEGDARNDAMARALVQAMTPEERRAFRRGGFGGASTYEMETVSPELFAANARIAERIRTEYCAAYPCAVTRPGS